EQAQGDAVLAFIRLCSIVGVELVPILEPGLNGRIVVALVADKLPLVGLAGGAGLLGQIGNDAARTRCGLVRHAEENPPILGGVKNFRLAEFRPGVVGALGQIAVALQGIGTAALVVCGKR